MSFDVKPCTSFEEFSDAILAVGQYFLLEPGSDRIERFSRNLAVERTHAAWDDARIVGGAGAFDFELTVPGSLAPAAGVTVVGTQPTHRRRGVLRALMRAQLDDVHERGEPLAILWASEETIYGRFGYGLASFVGEVAIPREERFAIPLEPQRQLRLVDATEARELFPRVWEAIRAEVPGMLRRTSAWWEHRILLDWRPTYEEVGPKRFVVLEREGRPEGYAVYRHRPRWRDAVPAGELEIEEAIALDGPATAELWRYLLDIDWIGSTTASLLPLDHALFHLLARPRRMKFQVYDGLWVRLVDVGVALSARTYAEQGSLVFDVADAFCPWNEGRWGLEGGGAERTDEPADLRCDVSVLGSIYLGAVGFSELVRAGRAEELTPGAARRADHMFAAERKPWCPEIF